MEKNHSQSRRLKRLRNERWKPYIRYEKETDRWISKAIRVDRYRDEEVDQDVKKEEFKILMDREQLDIIARLVAYMYNDKKDEYEKDASDLRKEHIYKDLRSIDQWLNIQYQRLEDQDERNKNINEFDLEIINEQSK